MVAASYLSVLTWLMLSVTVVVFLICLCGGDSDDTGHSVGTMLTLIGTFCVCVLWCKYARVLVHTIEILCVLIFIYFFADLWLIG